MYCAKNHCKMYSHKSRDFLVAEIRHSKSYLGYIRVVIRFSQ